MAKPALAKGNTMLDLLAAATGEAIRWEDLGLRPGIDLGFFTLRFYSLAYLAGIVLGYWHLTRMVKAPGSPMAPRHADDLFFYCTLGIILGGRLGYAAFYRPELFGSTELFMLWEGGMSFHGGVIGTVVAIAWVAWRGQLNFIRVCDYIAVNVGFGMLFGRIANFINGELWGRATDASVGMYFPAAPGNALRHPSQLYEALLEGVVLWAILWAIRKRPFPKGAFAGFYLFGYGFFRFFIEYFREPDEHLGLMWFGALSQGQMLCLAMMAAGAAFVYWRKRVQT